MLGVARGTARQASCGHQGERLSNRCKRSIISPRMPARAFAVAAVLAAGLCPNAALAAEPTYPFSIPVQPLEDALVKFGLQAGVSVGGADLARCGAMTQGVVGDYTHAAALSRLLSGTRCDFKAIDGRAFSVAPKAPAPRSEPVVTAPAATSAPTLVLDLTVTTTRRPSIVSLTPASVSLIGASTLVRGRLESLQDVSAEFSGVTITNLGPGRNKILIRGLSDGAFTGRTQSTVGLHLDDVPITYNAPDPDLRMIDIERVELMRGPQGSLYGVGSMGGIVRIVTKRPSLVETEVGFSAGGAVTKSGAPSYTLDGVINAPLVPGRLALRGVVYNEVTGGYVDDVALAIRDVNRTRKTGGRLAATAILSPDWSLTTGVTHQSLRSDDSQYAEGGAHPLERDILIREPHDNDFTQAYVSLDGSTALGRLRVSSAYLRHTFKTRYDASSGLPVFQTTANIRILDQADRVNLGVIEAVLTSRGDGRFQWLAGFFGSHTTEGLNYDLTAADTVIPLYSEDRRDKLYEAAIYGEATYAFTPSLKLTLGARAFHTWLKTDSVRDLVASTLSFQGSLKNSDISPKAVLSWRASSALDVYLQAAQGYRTGGFNTSGRSAQQFNASATGNQPNRQYRPDELLSYEIGLKTALLDRRLELRTAIFYTDWKDVQSDQFFPSGLPYTANVGRAANTGLEGEAAFRVDRALTLRTAFLANSPQLRERDPTYPARARASLPAVPRYSATLIADWRREIAPGYTASVYGRVAYIGSSILTFEERADSNMGNYVTARVSASLQTERWRMTAFVDNPANATGDTFAFGDPFTQGRVGQSTPLRPRTIGLTLAVGM